MAFLLCTAPAALAFPDGAPWETADQQAGCARCHFGSEVIRDSEALRILGLPGRVGPGGRCRLKVQLRAEEMASAGFLLSVSLAGEPAGELRSVDERTTSRGAQARSTRVGAGIGRTGLAEWTLEWRAGAAAGPGIVFGLWANAGNDDHSPFGDVVHHRTWSLPGSSRAEPR